MAEVLQAVDFREYFPRLPERRLIWSNYVCAYMIDGLEGVQVEKEVHTQVRVRLGEGSIGMGPRPEYLSIYFPGTQFTQEYRKKNGRCNTGKYTINLPYYDDEELETVKKLVWKALQV